MLVPVSTLLKPATLAEVGDAMVLPAPGRKPLFVLAGYGHALRTNYSLAEPEDFEVRLRIAEGVRSYELETLNFRVFPKAGTVPVDLQRALFYRLDTEQHDYFRIFLVCRQEVFAKEFDAQFTAIAFEAATAKDWRLENALEWCVTERREKAGELQPETGVKLPEKLCWRLRNPVFRAKEHRVLYQWELCSMIDGPFERPLITCVTDNEGAVTRLADLVPIRLLFAGGRAQLSPAAAAPPVAATPTAPVTAAPTTSAAPVPVPVPAPAPRPVAPPKVVPSYRRQALEERMRAAGEAEMAKIRKLFEMPD